MCVYGFQRFESVLGGVAEIAFVPLRVLVPGLLGDERRRWLDEEVGRDGYETGFIGPADPLPDCVTVEPGATGPGFVMLDQAGAV